MSEEAIVPSPSGFGNPSPEDGGSGDDSSCKGVASSCSCCEDLKYMKEMLEVQVAEGQYREKRLSNKIDDLTRLVRSLMDSIEERVAITPSSAISLNPAACPTVNASREQESYANATAARTVRSASNPAKRRRTGSPGAGPYAATAKAVSGEIMLAPAQSDLARGTRGRSRSRSRSAMRAMYESADSLDTNVGVLSSNGEPAADKTIPEIAEDDETWSLVSRSRSRPSKKKDIAVERLKADTSEEGLEKFILARSTALSISVTLHRVKVFPPKEGREEVCARITVNASDAPVLKQRSFWPGRLYCRDWHYQDADDGSGRRRQKPNQSSTTQTPDLVGEKMDIAVTGNNESQTAAEKLLAECAGSIPDDISKERFIEVFQLLKDNRPNFVRSTPSAASVVRYCQQEMESKASDRQQPGSSQ